MYDGIHYRELYWAVREAVHSGMSVDDFRKLSAEFWDEAANAKLKDDRCGRFNLPTTWWNRVC